MSRLIRRLLPWLALTLVAVSASVLSAYKVSLSPVGLHPRSVVFATAEAQVLVDNSPSALLTYGQNNFNELQYDVYDPNQAVLLIEYLQSQGPLSAMATAAGIPGKVVSASGPFTVQLGLSDTAPTGPQIGAPPNTDKDYRLLVDVNGVQPMLTLYGQAPTERAAAAIVDSARSQLFEYVAQQERGTSLGQYKKTVLRALGPTTGGVVDPGAKTQLLGVVFGLVMLLGGGLIVALRRRAAWLRRPVWARRPRMTTGPADDEVDLWPHTRRFLPWCMAVFMGMLFLVPIDALLASGVNSSAGTPVAPTLDRIMMVLIGVGWLVKLRSSRRLPAKLTRVHAAVFLFVGICFLGIALDGQQLAVFQEVMPTVKKLLVLMTFVTFFVLAADIIRPGEVRPLLKLMVALGVLCAIGTLIERQTRWNVFYNIWNGILPYTRPAEMDVLDDIGRLGVVGPTSEPLELATLLSLVLPFAMIFALEAKTRRERLWYVVASMIVMGGAIATARKTAIVAPLGGLLVLIAYRPRPILTALLKASIPLFLAIHILAPGQLGSVISELEPSKAAAVNTDKVRVERYDAVRPDIMSHLLLGRGFGSYDPVKYRYLDNEYLGLLIGTGLLGTAAFLAIFGSMFTLAHPLIRGPDESRSGLALAMQSAVLMIGVTSALFDTLSFYHVSYLLFFFGALLVALRKPTRSGRATPDGVTVAGTAARPLPPAPRPRRRALEPVG